jgi:hypothetical protein
MPVKVVQPADRGPMAAPLTINIVVIEAHRLCRPVAFNAKDEIVGVTLPERVARMYLDMHGEWNLPALAGISTAPLLAADGSICASVGMTRQAGCGAARCRRCACLSAPSARMLWQRSAYCVKLTEPSRSRTRHGDTIRISASRLSTSIIRLAETKVAS